MEKPRALDLFCKAGGATRGLQLAGFHVTGVDIEHQPRYCGDEFVQSDALTISLEGFDFIWAGPPCQAYTRAHFTSAREHPRLIVPIRHRLMDAGVLYVIENVPGAPLVDPQMLCGSSFGLGSEIAGKRYELRRHRIFESNFFFLAPLCQHRLPVVGIYGNGESMPVPGKRGFQISTERVQRDVMQMPWADRGEISEAIPPAYSEFIGMRAISIIRAGEPVFR